MLRTPNLPKPAEHSQWRDDVLNITFTVIGQDRDEVLVNCKHGGRQWTDSLHASLFGTELRSL